MPLIIERKSFVNCSNQKFFNNRLRDISFNVNDFTKWAEEECLNIINEYEADDPADYETLKSIIESTLITFSAEYDIHVKNICYLILVARTITEDTSECHEYEFNLRCWFQKK